MPGGRGFSAIFPGILTQNFARLPFCGLLNLPTLLPWRIVGNIVKSLRKLATSLLQEVYRSISGARGERGGSRFSQTNEIKRRRKKGRNKWIGICKSFEGRIKRQFVEIERWIQIHGK